MNNGGEAWRLTKQLENTLGLTQQAMERRMTEVTLSEREQDYWMREPTRVQGIIVRMENEKKEFWRRQILDSSGGGQKWFDVDGRNIRPEVDLMGCW